MTHKLLEGFRQFYAAEYKGHGATMPELVKNGQSPDYFIISCIDSRSHAGTIFNAPPGTFFGFKAMGAIVRPYRQGTALSAALQFALTITKVPNLIILGHTQCGAVKALVEHTSDEEIASFIDVAQSCLKKARATVKSEDQVQRATEEQIILTSIRNLESYPSVALALSENRLEIHGWLFDMQHGELLEYNPEVKRFTSICDPE